MKPFLTKPALLASLAILSAGLAVVACASGAGGAPSGSSHAANGDRFQCFDTDFIRSFQTVDDHTIVVESSQGQGYELKLGGVCIGLDTSFMIGLRSRMGSSQVCGPFDADVVYNDNGGIRGHQECPITEVRHLNADEAAKYFGRRTHSDKKKEGTS